MSKPAFTPGPWIVDPLSLKVMGPNINGGEFSVCDIRGWGYLTGRGHGALGLSEHEAIAIQEANAALISAAPEQNAALIEAREALDACEDYFDKRQDADCDQDGFIPNEEMRLLSMIGKALAQVDAALAKATGGQP